MGSMIAGSSDLTSASVPALLSDLGVGVASIFVTAVLIYILAYLNVVENSEQKRDSLRSLLTVVSIPLSFAFAGIMIYESLAVIGFL